MSNYENFKQEEIYIEELDGMDKVEQAEKIANDFSKVSNEYSKIDMSALKINIENPPKPVPSVSSARLYEILREIKTNKSTIRNDIPAKIIKEFADEISTPLSFLINNIIKDGKYPVLYKMERVTPVPKEFPPKTTKQLRKISGTYNFSLITEKVISSFMNEDMKTNRDSSQYGNEKSLSVNHYLIKMVHKILSLFAVSYTHLTLPTKA